MRILERRIFLDYISSFFFCIMLLMLLAMIGDVLGFLDDIFKNNIPLASVFSFYLFFIPFAYVNMVPFACLLGAVFVFNNLSKNHEITAMITSGISLWNVARPVLVGTFILCLATLAVNEKLVPFFTEKASRIRQEELETSEKGRNAVKNVALYGKGDLIIFAKNYYPREKKLEDAILHKQDKSNAVVMKINAKEAKWRSEGYWQGTDVMVFNVDKRGGLELEPEVHKSSKLPIQESPSEFLKGQNDARFMNYRQLKKYIRTLCAGSNISVRRLVVDLNYKVSFPFTAMVTVIMGIPFSVAAGRVNVFLGMAKGIAAAMLYVPAMAVSLALGKGGFLSPFLSAWLGIFVFTALGAYYINKRS